MIRLTRTVRFCINPPAPERSAADADPGASHNGFGGKPAMSGLGRYYELDLEVTGDPDPDTGYLVSIRDLDTTARVAALPIIERACVDAPHTDPSEMLHDLARAVTAELPDAARLARLRWRLTPTYSTEIRMPDADRAVLRQRFDFAAAHRLHAPALSDDDNRALYGRCNNPAGHGHNYVFEPAVAVRLDPDSPRPAFDLAALERLADRVILDRYDHAHLNADTPEFDPDRGGAVPSVEHIARTFYERLGPAVADASEDAAELLHVTVWETDRTSATYPAE